MAVIDAPTAAAPRSPISIVIIEESGLLREGLTTLVALQPDLRILAASGDIDGGKDTVRRYCPQVVLLGFDMGRADGPGTTTAILAASPASRLVLMGLRPGQADLAAHVRAGATGLVLRDATVEDLYSTIRTVALGIDVLPAALLTTLFAQMSHERDDRSPEAAKGYTRLTPRENEVMSEILEGRSNKEIAIRLHIAVDTVKSHVHRLLQKLSLRSRVEIIAQARFSETRSRHPALDLASKSLHLPA